MISKKKVYRFTIFQSNPFGHGAERRTAQISEILDEFRIEWRTMPSGMQKPDSKIKLFKRWFRLFFLFIKVSIIVKKRFNLRKLINTISLVSNFKEVYSLKKEDAIFFWEITRMETSFLIPLLKKLDYKIIAFPHNLESLVPEQRSGISNQKSPDWFFEEIRILKRCDIIFAISLEETILLKQFGIKAYFLPYYPHNIVKEQLLKIRDERQKLKYSEKVKKILILGSAINSPTRIGMIDRINYFVDNEISNIQVIIAGFGTEQFKEEFEKKNNILILGELSDTELAEQLVKIDALLIHQPATSGALTRITEMLIAGIPVITNFEGGRTYHNTDGVNIYYNNSQMLDLINTQLITPPIPERPAKQIEVLRKEIEQIEKKGHTK
jgi:hypothetical protein